MTRRPPEFGSPEWAITEKAHWRRSRRRSWLGFWLSWVWLCLVVWLVARADAGDKWSLIFDGVSLALVGRSTFGFYRLTRMAQDMEEKVDDVVSTIQQLL